MPEYSLDADTIQAEIRALPVTSEPILSDAELAMTAADRELMQQCFHEIGEGTSFAIRNLRLLTNRYPDVVSLKNHLNIAYCAAGKDRQSDRLTRQIFEEHPDYLFARLNRAGDFLGEKDGEDDILEMLGTTLRLADLQAEREVFHVSEIRGFYNIVALFHLRNDRPHLAKAIHEELVDILDDDDETLRRLQLIIASHNLERMQERVEADEARAIQVTVSPPRKGSAEMFAPGFLHAQIGELYRHDLSLPADILAEILALPRESAIADLEAVLRDGIERGALYCEEQIECADEESWFPLHAIFLLGELKAGESLPVVLEFLSQHPDVLDFWFGELLTGALWEPLYWLVEGRLDETLDWMLSAGIPADSREALAIAVAQIAFHQPERRPEVLDWFRRILEFLRDSPAENNILDTDLVNGLVWLLMDLGANELLLLVNELWEKGYLAESHLGNFEEISKVLSEPPDANAVRMRYGIVDRYRKLHAALDPSAPRPGNDVLAGSGPGMIDVPFAAALSPSAAPANVTPFRAEPKVGRNDPCPCGSGKKYKKCCL